MRIERDFLGEKTIPDEALWGIHTMRAQENFPVSGQRVPEALIRAFGDVKLACARANYKLGYLQETLCEYIEKACFEMQLGDLSQSIVVDAFQGGAGTSTNLNVCEVLANRVLELQGQPRGRYDLCDPIEHINLHQSTNDVYSTALRVALLKELKKLEDAVNVTQEVFQAKESEYAEVLKMARTELMDAVPMTFGRTFGAWADALSRDRWRLFKASERLRVVNLGGTAIGTGMGAPKKYIFMATEELKTLTGLPVARAENLVDATQNQDVLVESMGMIKAHASNLMKIAGDLRLLAMGPAGGIAELELPAVQAGSSLMPGKVNPVIPEMLAQVSAQVIAYDQAVTWAAASGQLELNAFLPLAAFNMLAALDMLTRANRLLCDRLLTGLKVRVDRCSQWVFSGTAVATVLVPKIGYRKATDVAILMQREGLDLVAAAERVAGLKPDEVAALLKPAKLNELGF